MFTLTVNGESHTLPEKLTVAQLLDRLGFDRKRVAVEVNCEVVPAMLHTDRKRTVQPALFERLYDRDMHVRFPPVQRAGNWWVVDVKDIAGGVLVAEKGTEPSRSPASQSSSTTTGAGTSSCSTDPARSCAQTLWSASDRSIAA